VEVASGTFQVAGATTFNFPAGLFQWTGGIIDIPGDSNAQTLTNDGAITIANTSATGNVQIAGGGTLANAGIIDETGAGGLALRDGSAIDNQGTGIYDFQADSSIVPGFNGGSFTNAGTLEKTAGTGTSAISVGLSFSNVITVITAETGTLSLPDVTSITNSTITIAGSATISLANTTCTGSTFSLAAGTTLDLTGGSTATYDSCTFTGAGTVALSSGTMALGIGGVIMNVGNFEWTGGNISGALGDFTLLGTMTIAGSSEHGFFNDGTLDDKGTIVQTGTGNLGLHSDNRFPTTLQIDPGAVYVIEADSGIDNPFGGQTAVINEGTIEKTGGTGTSTLDVNGTISNTGTIEVDSGTLALAGSVAQVVGSELTASIWSALNGSTLAFPSGANIATNQATLTLAGQGASIAGLQGLTTNLGTLTLTDGASLGTTGDLSDGNSSVGGRITIGPGSTLAVAGKFAQGPAATLDVQLGGAPAGGQFGQMAVTGPAALDGTLQAELVDGYVPKAGDGFKVMSFASSTGSFATIDTPLFHGGNLFQVQTSPTNITVAAATSVANLQVTSVTASPSPVQTGQDVTVNYTVQNSGNATTATSWVDSVFLSAGGAIDSSAILLGRVKHNGAVAANGSYTGSLTAAIPAILPGNYFLVVEADSRGLVADANRATTVQATASPVLVTVPTVTLGGAPVTGTMVTGQPVLLAISDPTGEDFNITMPSGATGSGTLLVGYEAIPTDNPGGSVGFVSFGFDAQLGISTLRDQFQGGQAGTYYALINWQGPTASAGYSFSASGVGLSVDLPSPSAAPAANNVTLTMEGTGFTSQTRVSLVSGSTTIPADRVTAISFDGTPFLTATFDLTGAPPASNYAVEVSDNGRTASTPAAFTVFAPSSRITVTTGEDNGSIAANVEVPSAVRPGRVYSLTVSYHSTALVGSTVLAPILELSADNVEFQLLGQSGFTPGSIMLLGTNAPGQNSGPGIGSATQPAVLPGADEPAELLTQGAGGVLLPPTQFIPEYDGFSDSITVNFIATAPGSVNFSLGVADAGTPIDWSSLESQLQPTIVPTAAWSAIFTNFTAQVGNTMGGLQTALDNDANYLAQLGIYTSDPMRLMAFQLEQAGNFGAIAARYRPGIFGQGIPDPTVTATTDAEGNVDIVSGGTVEPYTLQADGTYQAAPGDFSTLTLTNGIYQLRETGGTLKVFNENGTLNSIEDTDGNKAVYSYTGSHLTSITETATGDVTSFSYNAQGLVNQITDPEGRITSLTYDSAGHLLSITNPQGTTTYTYVTSGTTQQLNALASITNPDGSQVLYTYNSQGQLIGESQNGGADPLTFRYDIGAITTTDALGNTTTEFLDDDEQTVRIVDPLGNVIQGVLDHTGEPTSLTSSGGSTSVSYNDLGNPISSIDPMGQQTIAGYNPTFDEAQSITDPLGHRLSYSYDPNDGNLLSITYPDGSSQQYAYDATGNVTQLLNRNVQAIAYAYNSHDLVTSETFPDSSQDTFTYDAHQNLVSTTDSTGTTKFTYDSADRLTKVTYPGGTFLEYTYNADGQRSRMTDQTGFTVNYQYDALGRLSKLTDGSGNLIVSYTYNAASDLSGEQFGNGTSTRYTFDADGNVLSIVNLAPNGSTRSSYVYTYDNQNLPITMTTAAGTFTYAYDADGQLISVQEPGGQTITYEYDAAGNRVAVVSNGTTTQYAANDLNEYTQAGNTTFQYDANGDLISSTNGSGTTTYGYNVLGQLTRVVAPSGTTTYTYDALGQLVSEDVDGTVTDLLNDPTGIGNLVGEFANNGSTVAQYAYGLGLVSQTGASGGSDYYDFDLTGNTTQLTSADGSVLDSYSYLPFGELLSSSGSTANPFTYVGQFGVMDAGNGLYFMRSRYYDAALGRFTTPDPIGVAGGVDLYTYANNLPTTMIDPVGLKPAAQGEQQAVKGLQTSIDTQQTDAGAVQHATNGTPTFGGTMVKVGGPTVATKVVGLAAKDAGGSPAVSTAMGTGVKLIGGASALVNGLVLELTERNVLNNIFNLPELGGNNNSNSAQPTAPNQSDQANQVIQQLAQHDTPLGQSLQNNGQLPPDQALIQAMKDTHRQVVIADGFKFTVVNGKLVAVPISHDPNEITGPAGFGSQGFLKPAGPLPYRIDFTNQSSASAPAANVVVTQQLSSNLDLSTFQFGDIGFGGTTIQVPQGLTSYSTEVTLPSTAPGAGPNGLIVQVSASLNLATGLVTWTFTSLDPTTMDIPINPFEGFLPPDDSKADGEGFVSYTVEPKTGLATGTAINAQATVVFDQNAPISTKAIVNTLDTAPPTTSVNALPGTTSSPSFTVSWSGSDGAGPGIASFDVFVSDDGGAFRPFLTGTTQTSATFTGQVGHTYGFYSVATDNLGLVQSTPTAAQATIAVVNSPPPPPPPVTVTSVHWGTLAVKASKGKKAKTKSETVLEVQFSGAVAGAGSLSAYQLATVKTKKVKKHVVRTLKPIRLSAVLAASSPMTTSVALVPASKANPSLADQLEILATTITDAEGRPLTGNESQPGTNAIIEFGRGGANPSAVVDRARVEARDLHPAAVDRLLEQEDVLAD
jgi:RHS repeat-associated protein